MIPLFLQAQTKSDSTNVSSGITLSEVVITTDIFENKKKDFAGSVSEIKPKILNQANGLYLQPVLNSVPGVYMQSGALNTNRITIRGIGSRSPFATNKIKAYLDDIPLSTGEGETTLEDIDFSTLGGIEVYRGPASTMYGAGLGGAIHMVTKKMARTNSGYFDFSVGSFGLKKVNISAQTGNENRGINLFFQDVSSDGYRQNNEYGRQSLSAIARTKIGAKSYLSGYFNYTHLKSFIPSALDEDTYLNSPKSAATQWANAKGFEDNNRVRLGLSLKTMYNEFTESTLAVFTNIGKSREVTPFGNEDITTSNLGLRGKIRRNFLPQDKLAVVMGTEIFVEGFRIKSYENNNSQNGDMTSDLNQDRSYGNVFLATEYLPSKNWVLSVGGNLNFSYYKNTDEYVVGNNDLSGDHTFSPIFSPKISVTRHLSEKVSAYGLVSHGFSLPTFDETLNPGGNINEDIRPEKGLNYELGIKGSAPGGKVYAELVYYTMRINDLLVARRNSELDYSGYNAGKSTHNGVEMLINHQLLKTNTITIDQSFSYTLMRYRFDEFTDDDKGDFSGNKLTGVPSYTTNYYINIESNIGVYARVNWQSVGEMPILDDNSVFSDGYNLVNLKIGFQQEFDKLSVNVYGGINNLLDEKYASMLQINPNFNKRYYYPGLPVNFFSGIKVAYRF
ncbi:TonB-dependent receptor [Reichenbachiella sp. MALMAid0571]|uniref:TonB-dependent receptor n=1 Tax=Reichenbachiella sp. MALMAid0571 TaxID=3143939 RepID=UPI0032DF4B9F